MLTKLVGSSCGDRLDGVRILRNRRRSRLLTGAHALEVSLTEKNASDRVSISLRLTPSQVQALPEGARNALDQLIRELRAAGSVVPESRPLSDIADEIDELAESAGESGLTASLPGGDIRAALSRRAEEVRRQDWLPLVGPDYGTCPWIMAPAPYVVIDGDLIVLPVEP
jgi:hypothetical protein